MKLGVLNVVIKVHDTEETLNMHYVLLFVKIIFMECFI